MQDDLVPTSLVECRRATRSQRKPVSGGVQRTTYVLNHMAMVTDEKKGATVDQIELHPDQAFIQDQHPSCNHVF